MAGIQLSAVALSEGRGTRPRAADQRNGWKVVVDKDSPAASARARKASSPLSFNAPRKETVRPGATG